MNWRRNDDGLFRHMRNGFLSSMWDLPHPLTVRAPIGGRQSPVAKQEPVPDRLAALGARLFRVVLAGRRLMPCHARVAEEVCQGRHSLTSITISGSAP